MLAPQLKPVKKLLMKITTNVEKKPNIGWDNGND
jgi:hypothetical protein